MRFSRGLQAKKWINTTFLPFMYERRDNRVLIGRYNPHAAPRSLQPTAEGYSLAAAKHAAMLLAIRHHGIRQKSETPPVNSHSTFRETGVINDKTIQRTVQGSRR